MEIDSIGRSRKVLQWLGLAVVLLLTGASCNTSKLENKTSMQNSSSRENKTEVYEYTIFSTPDQELALQAIQDRVAEIDRSLSTYKQLSFDDNARAKLAYTLYVFVSPQDPGKGKLTHKGYDFEKSFYFVDSRLIFTRQSYTFPQGETHEYTSFQNGVPLEMSKKIIATKGYIETYDKASASRTQEAEIAKENALSSVITGEIGFKVNKEQVLQQGKILETVE